MAVLTDALFQRRYAGRTSVIGQTIGMNGANYTVIGILPREFHLPALREGMEDFKPEIDARRRRCEAQMRPT